MHVDSKQFVLLFYIYQVQVSADFNHIRRDSVSGT